MLSNLNQYLARLVDHQDGGKFLLRVTFSVLMIFHGVAKLQHGTGWIEQILISNGIPSFVAYGVFIGEIIAPVLIILGIFTRLAAFIVAMDLLIATLMVGMDKFFTVTNVGAWGLEIEAMYFFAALITMLLGSGRYSIVSPAYR